MKKIFGLIGNNLKYSFSKDYFEKKFIREDITNSRYNNFQINDIKELKKIIRTNNISGLNVTMPFKIEVMSFMNNITKEAEEIGSVNTIKIKKNHLTGYNTDVIGFRRSIIPILKNRKKALILGSGGSSRTVRHVLSKLKIEYNIVSRESSFDYSDIDTHVIDHHDIIINTTPLGMFPKEKESPKIPYHLLSKKHLLYDLIYNPTKTRFLCQGELYGAEIKNGLEMLEIQAKESWKIWNL